MYRNIGGKIKGGAIAFFIILAIGSFIPGLALTLSDVAEVGIPLLIGGPLFAWISTWTLYGFGELISKTSEIAHYVKCIAENSAAPGSDAPSIQWNVVSPPKTRPAQSKLNSLLRQELIPKDKHDKTTDQ